MISQPLTYDTPAPRRLRVHEWQRSYITLTEYSLIMGLSSAAARKSLDQLAIRFVRVGQRIWVLREDVESLLFPTPRESHW
ncbi:hypothetical protein D7316_02251 [Gordonia insulae]|uniref:Helix-turn-helix domain-containing protein n=1 Tax=Gordonia insulae TaxID=2420509 RepID=A0A3G8JKN7_9ACTN|nr:hypothetical protein D7316_02251 [Gordonia insulae]